MQWILNLDKSILLFVNEHLTNPFLDILMLFFSRISDSGIIWILLGVLLLVSTKRRNTGIALLSALALSCLLGEGIIKHLAERPRPFWNHTEVALLINAPSGFSFPSGHTMSSFAAATVLWNEKRSWGIYGGILAIIIAFSRVYLFVHYPLDIIFGMILGIICGVMIILIFKKISIRRKWDI